MASGFGGPEAEDEVLVPAHEAVVSPSEGDVGGAVRKVEGDGGKLLSRLGVHARLEHANACVREAPASRHLWQQERRQRRDEPLCRVDLALAVREEVGVGNLGHGRAVMADVQVEVAQLRQNQVVDLVEGHGPQRKVAVPVQVVEDVGHAFPLWYRSPVTSGPFLCACGLATQISCTMDEIGL